LFDLSKHKDPEGILPIAATATAYDALRLQQTGQRKDPMPPPPAGLGGPSSGRGGLPSLIPGATLVGNQAHSDKWRCGSCRFRNSRALVACYQCKANSKPPSPLPVLGGGSLHHHHHHHQQQQQAVASLALGGPPGVAGGSMPQPRLTRGGATPQALREIAERGQPGGGAPTVLQQQQQQQQHQQLGVGTQQHMLGIMSALGQVVTALDTLSSL
jgi:hypothetical protein